MRTITLTVTLRQRKFTQFTQVGFRLVSVKLFTMPWNCHGTYVSTQIYFDVLMVSCKPTMMRPPPSRKDLWFESQRRSICIAELADGITAKSKQTKLHLRTTSHYVGEINSSRKSLLETNEGEQATSYLFLLPKGRVELFERRLVSSQLYRFLWCFPQMALVPLVQKNRAQGPFQ